MGLSNCQGSSTGPWGTTQGNINRSTHRPEASSHRSVNMVNVSMYRTLHKSRYSSLYTGPYIGPYTGPCSGPYTGPCSGPYTGPCSGPNTGPYRGPYTGSYIGADTGRTLHTCRCIIQALHVDPYIGLYTGPLQVHIQGPTEVHIQVHIQVPL